MFSIIDAVESKTDSIIRKYFEIKQVKGEDSVKKEIFETDQKLHELELVIHKYCEEINNGTSLDHCKNDLYNQWILDHAGSFRKFLNSCKMISFMKDFILKYKDEENSISDDEELDKFIKDYFNSNITWLDSFFY